jgi:hypothetical protein
LDKYLGHSKKLGRLRYCQTAIKSRTGIGKPIVIYFYAPEPIVKPGDDIATVKYDYRSCGDEITMIRNNDDHAYCQK